MIEKATYSGKSSALDHRARHGGWVFAWRRANGMKAWTWYAPHWTPSAIFTDPENQGRDGELI